MRKNRKLVAIWLELRDLTVIDAICEVEDRDRSYIIRFLLQVGVANFREAGSIMAFENKDAKKKRQAFASGKTHPPPQAKARLNIPKETKARLGKQQLERAS